MSGSVNLVPELLVTCCANSLDLIRKSATKLPAHSFLKPGQRHLAVIWSVLAEWYILYKVLVPFDFLLATSITALSEDPELASDQVFSDLFRVLTDIKNFDPEVLKSPELNLYITKEVQGLIDHAVIIPAIVAGTQNGDSISESVDNITTQYKRTRMASPVEEDLDEYIPAETFVKVTTGFRPIDEIMYGGWAPGDVLGLIGPSGGGKTSLAIQLAIDMAKCQNRHVLYLPYENKIRPEYWRRFIGRSCGIRSDVMKDFMNIGDMPEVLRDIVKVEWTEKTKPWFHVCEMLNDEDGVVGVEALLADYEARGIHISLVVVDQYLQVLERHRALTGSKNDTRKDSGTMTMDFMTLAGVAETSIVLLHQKTAALNSVAPCVHVKKGQAQEDKAFDNWLPYCIGLGNSDHESRMWLDKLKSRHVSGANSYVIRLDGDGYQMYDDSENFHGEFDGTNFVARNEKKKTNVGRTDAVKTKFPINLGTIEEAELIDEEVPEECML